MAIPEETLREGLAALGLEFDAAQVSQLLGFAALLQKWTRVYNLTALRRTEDVLTHHILDCAAVVAPLRSVLQGREARLLDVGSGGGLPGAVIAIADPQIRVDCVDAVAKKAAFIREVSAGLRLANLAGIHARVESVSGPYDVIASRAFASVADFVRLSAQALGERGVWMAMKGKYPADEIAALPSDVELFHVEQLQVPGLAADRRLLWLRRRNT